MTLPVMPVSPSVVPAFGARPAAYVLTGSARAPGTWATA